MWVCVKTLAPLSFASKCIKIAGAHGCSPPIRLAFHNLILMSCDNSRQSPRCSKTGRRNRGGPERAAGWQLGKECWQSIVGPKKIENLHQRHHQTWKGFPKLHFLGKSIWCSPWHFLDSSRHVTPQRRVLPLFWDAGSKVAHLCCRACRRMKSMKSLKPLQSEIGRPVEPQNWRWTRRLQRRFSLAIGKSIPHFWMFWMWLIGPQRTWATFAYLKRQPPHGRRQPQHAQKTGIKAMDSDGSEITSETRMRVGFIWRSCFDEIIFIDVAVLICLSPKMAHSIGILCFHRFPTYAFNDRELLSGAGPQTPYCTTSNWVVHAWLRVTRYAWS
jgi:hypothetical protein